MPLYPEFSSPFSGQRGRLLRVGRSLNCPFRSLSDAVAASLPHDRVELESGDYYEAISVTHPLEIAGVTGEEPPCINACGPCFTVNADGAVLIENIKITAKGSKPSDSMALLIVHGCPVVRACELSAVHVLNESAPSVSHCRILRAERGCGLVISHEAGGEYMHNEIAYHPEECVRIQSTGQPNLHNNRILNRQQSRALVMITGGKFATSCQPIFCDNIVCGSGSVNLEERPDPAVLLSSTQLTTMDVHSAECLVHVSWGAKPLIQGNLVCNGVHGFLFSSTHMPAENFVGNRVANCSGWAVTADEGCGLFVYDCEVQHCAGALRVLSSTSVATQRADRLRAMPIQAPNALETLTHTMVRDARRASVAQAFSSMKERQQFDNREAFEVTEVMSAFRHDLIASLKRDAAISPSRASAKKNGSTKRQRKHGSTTPPNATTRLTEETVSRCTDDSETGKPSRRSHGAVTFDVAEGLTPVDTADVSWSAGSSNHTSVCSTKTADESQKTNGSFRKDATVVVTQCTFRCNYRIGLFVERSWIDISSCRFIENFVGLVISRDCSASHVAGNVFEGNLHASILCTNRAVVSLDSNTIKGGATSATKSLLGGDGRHSASADTSRQRSEASRGVPSGASIAFRGTAAAVLPSASLSSANHSEHGVMLSGYSNVVLRGSTVAGHIVNVAVTEGSRLHADTNQLRGGNSHNVLVSGNSCATIQDSRIEESGKSSVVFAKYSRGVLRRNHIFSSADAGVLADSNAGVELLDNNILHGCRETLSARHGGAIYAEQLTSTLGTVDIGVHDEGSECIVVSSQFASSADAFAVVDGPHCMLSARDTQFESCLGTSLVLSDGGSAELERCTLLDATKGHVQVSSYTQPSRSNGCGQQTSLRLHRCQLRGSKATGIAVSERSLSSVASEGYVKVSVTQCTIAVCDTVGVSLAVGADTYLADNSIISCGGVGVVAAGRGHILRNSLDGWNRDAATNGLVGLHLSAGATELQVKENSITDFHVGVSVEERAAVAVHDTTVSCPVDAGVLVVGRAAETVFHALTVDRSDGVGVLLRDGAVSRFSQCTVRDSLVAGVVVGWRASLYRPSSAVPNTLDELDAAAAFSNCSFFDNSCEVLADAEYVMKVEGNPAHRDTVLAFLRGASADAKPPSRSRERTQRLSLAARRRTLRRPPTADGLSTTLPPSAETSSMGDDETIEPSTEDAARFHECTIGGPFTRQGVVVLRGSLTLDKCRLTAGGAADSVEAEEALQAAALVGAPAVLPASQRQGSGGEMKPRRTASGTRKRRASCTVDLLPNKVSTDNRKAADALLRLLPLGLGIATIGPAVTGATLQATPVVLRLTRSVVQHCTGAGLMAAKGAWCVLEECSVRNCEVGLCCAAAITPLAHTAHAGPDAEQMQSHHEDQCTVRFSHVTVSRCTQAGVRWARGGGVSCLSDSIVEQCRTAMLLESGAQLQCVRTELTSCGGSGVHVVGLPDKAAYFRDVRISDCEEYGIYHENQRLVRCDADGVSSDGSVAPGEPVMGVGRMKLQNCNICRCARAAAFLEGVLDFDSCSFRDNDTGSRPEGLAAGEPPSPPLPATEAAPSASVSSHTSAVVCWGPCCDATFLRCLFSSTEGETASPAQVVGGGDASLALEECILEGTGRSSCGLALVQPRRAHLVRCKLQGYVDAITYSSLSARSLESDVAPAQPSSAGAAAHVQSEVSAGKAGSRASQPSIGERWEEMSAPPVVCITECALDRRDGNAFIVKESASDIWKLAPSSGSCTREQFSPAARSSGDAALAEGIPRYRLLCSSCTFTDSTAEARGAVPPLLTLGRLCHDARFDQCSFTSAQCGVRLGTGGAATAACDDPVEMMAEFSRCIFANCTTAIEVHAGKSFELSHCKFEGQKRTDVVLTGCKDVCIHDNVFLSPCPDGECVRVVLGFDYAFRTLRRWVGGRWASKPEKQRKLVQSWLALTESEERSRPVGEWSIRDNRFARVNVGVVVRLVSSSCNTGGRSVSFPTSLPTVALPSFLGIGRNSFADCLTGLRCEECAPESLSDVDEKAMTTGLSADPDDGPSQSAVLALLPRAASTKVRACANEFVRCKYGAVVDSGFTELLLWQNTFDCCSGAGVSAHGFSNVSVCENVFHGRPKPTEAASGAAGQGTTARAASSPATRAASDEVAAVWVTSRAGGYLSRNVFQDNAVAVRVHVSGEQQVRVCENLFTGNQVAVRVVTETVGSATITAETCAVGILRNTFVGGKRTDVHVTAAANGTPSCTDCASAVCSESPLTVRAAVYIAFNRFTSFRVAASLLVDAVAGRPQAPCWNVHVYGNVFTANAMTAVRLAAGDGAAVPAVALMSNLFFAVDCGVDVSAGAGTCLLTRNVFAQHSVIAVRAAAGTVVHACECLFACYPDHTTVECDTCAAATFVGCGFFSVRHAVNTSVCALVFGGACAKAVVAYCLFSGPCSGAAVEGRSSVRFQSARFQAVDTGVTVRTGAEVFVEDTCTFTRARLAGVKLMGGSRGKVCVSSGSNSGNTVVSAGEHSVEVRSSKQSAAEDPGHQLLSLAVFLLLASLNPEEAAVAEMEKQMLNSFFHCCLDRTALPLWALGDGETENSDAAGGDPASAADTATPAVAHRKTHKGAGKMNRDALAELYKQCTAAGGEPNGESTAASAALLSLVAASASTATKPPPSAAPSAKQPKTTSVQRKAPEEDLQGIVAAADKKRVESQNCLAALPANAVADDAVDEMRQWISRDSRRNSNTTVASGAASVTDSNDEQTRSPTPSDGETGVEDDTGAPVHDLPGIVDAVACILRAVAERHRQTQGIHHSWRTAGTTFTLSSSHSRNDGSVDLETTTDTSTTRLQAPASVSAEDGAKPLKRERSMRRAEVAKADAQQKEVWNPFFTRAGSTRPSNRREVSGIKAASEAALQPTAVVDVPSVKTQSEDSWRARFPLKSTFLQYAACPVSRLPLPLRSFAAYLRQRQSTDDKGSPRRPAAGEMSDSTGQVLEDELESAQFPSYFKERIFLTNNIGFSLFYNDFYLYEEETVEPDPPTLYAFEDEAATSQFTFDTPWSRFWAEEDSRRAVLQRREDIAYGTSKVKRKRSYFSLKEPAQEQALPTPAGANKEPAAHTSSVIPEKATDGAAEAQGTVASAAASGGAVVTESTSVLQRRTPSPGHAAEKKRGKKVKAASPVAPTAPKTKRKKLRKTSQNPVTPPAKPSSPILTEHAKSDSTPGSEVRASTAVKDTAARAAREPQQAPPTAPTQPPSVAQAACALQTGVRSIHGQPDAADTKRMKKTPTAAPVLTECSHDTATTALPDEGTHSPTLFPVTQVTASEEHTPLSSSAPAERQPSPDARVEADWDSTHAPTEVSQRASSGSPSVKDSHSFTHEVNRSREGQTSADQCVAEQSPSVSAAESFGATTPLHKAASPLHGQLVSERGKSGLPVTVASSLRPPRVPSLHSDAEVRAHLTTPPVVQEEETQRLWEAIFDLVNREFPDFAKRAPDGAESSTENAATGPAVPDEAGITPVPAESASSHQTRSSPDANCASNAASDTRPAAAEELNDILAILHWLAERRKQMKEDVYERAMERMMEGTAHVKPFTKPRSFCLPPSAPRSCAPSRTTSPGMESSGPADSPDGANEEERLIFFPLAAGPSVWLPSASRDAKSSDAQQLLVPCVAVRLRAGRGVLHAHIVYLSPDDIPAQCVAPPPHRRARQRLAEDLHEAHPDFFPKPLDYAARDATRDTEQKLSATTVLLTGEVAAARAKWATRAHDGSRGYAGGLARTTPGGAGGFSLEHGVGRSLTHDELQRKLVEGAARSATQPPSGAAADPALTTPRRPTLPHPSGNTLSATHPALLLFRQQSLPEEEKSRARARGRPHRIKALPNAAAHTAAGRQPDFDPGNPSATTPFDVAENQPHAFYANYLSRW